MHARPSTAGADLRLEKLLHHQFELVQRNNAPSAFAMPAFSIVISAMLTEWVPFDLLVWWVLAVCAASAGLFVANTLYERSGRRPVDTPRWTMILAGVSVVLALAWITPSIFFWSYCGDIGRLLLSLVVACSIAGTAALLSPSPPMLATTLVPYSFALIVPPLFQGTPFYYGLSALGVGFCLFMIHLARQVYLTSRDMLMLREDKNELIEQLTAAKIDSDKARLRAETASRAKSEFLANMSHELRTPLNAILGFSEIMKNEVFGRLGRPQYVDYAKHIHGSGQHLLGLINDVLDLAKIEAGRFQVRAIEIDLREAITDALVMFEVGASEAQVKLAREVEKDLPLLLADERGMRQVLLNLISNAIKFTRPGGSVTAFARRSPGGGMEVGVTDTGVGIDPADVNHVFEAFGQGQHDVAVHEKGTGLGLSIVRGLVEAHGGKVKLDSALGKGTTVTCVFPRERVTAPQPVPIRLATVL